MRIQIASDLHLEHLERAFPCDCTISPAHQADVLVLAGDIGQGVSALELFHEWPVPVLYVAGNHEAYGACWTDAIQVLRASAKGSAVHFLDRDTVHFGGVRFLGCTLWTDYRLRSNRTQRQLMEHAELRISDHYRIRNMDGSHFLAADAFREHELSRKWLEIELATPYDGKTVVISHHGPHPLSVHPRFIGDHANAAFVSDLSELLSGPDLWVHGHVHDSFDYRVSSCRVVANPRGYAKNARSSENFQDLTFENSTFQPALVLEV